MTKIEFCKQLENEILDTENISISITTAKGIITLFGSVTFSEKTNHECFLDLFDEINWLNMKLQVISQKYQKYLIKSKFIDENNTIYFDEIFAKTKPVPVKRKFITNTQSFGSFLQFIFKD
jgi:hypothetical protein